MIFNEVINKLELYEPGKPIELIARDYGVEKENIIKLASNENPLGCSPKALEAIKASKPELYPDDSYFELKHELASFYGLESENFIIGSGSDQVIEFAIHALCNKNKGILCAGITFAMYEIYAKFTDSPVFKTKSAEHDLAELLSLYKAHKENIGIVILCLPNNPLGECADASEIEEFISQIDSDTLVMLDCAYMEFAAFKDAKKALDPARLLAKFSNVLYLRTFSKAYGLGGMRVGYGIGTPALISVLHKLRAPFNISTPSLAAAIAAIKDQDFVNKTLENNLNEMKKYEEFAKKHNIKYTQSYTNFITFYLSEGKNSSQIAENLLKKGIILRNLKSYNLNAIRITIGTPSQNERLLAALEEEII